MIITLNFIADNPAFGKRREPMGAAITQGNRPTILLAVKYDRLIKQRARQRLTADLV